jgi:hypothetical protein
MNGRQLEQCLKKASTREELMAATHRIRQIASDSSVLSSLCKAAIETKHHDVREALIEILKNNAEEACKGFSDYAIQSPNANRRRWALVSLSLMECRTAKEAVLHGLQDSERKVRVAAAMNAGLYDDKEVLAALEHFFTTNRFACVLGFTDLMVKEFLQNNRPKMILDVACLQDELRSPSVPSI